MRSPLRLMLAGLLGLAAAFLVACGGSSKGLLSSDQAAALNGRLSALATAISSSQCGQAVQQAQALAADVARLPSTVNSTLRQNLIQGVSTVQQLTPRDCTVPTTTQTQSVTTATTATTTTTSAPTTTQAASTTTQATPTATQTIPAQTTSTPTTDTGGTTTPGTGGAGLGNTTSTSTSSSGGAGASGGGGGGG